MTNLEKYAVENCYSCQGTGYVKGFGHTGLECPCINDCSQDCGNIANPDNYDGDDMHYCDECLDAC